MVILEARGGLRNGNRPNSDDGAARSGRNCRPVRHRERACEGEFVLDQRNHAQDNGGAIMPDEKKPTTLLGHLGTFVFWVVAPTQPLNSFLE